MIADTPQTVLFVRERSRDYPVQLSTHHLAAAAEKGGDTVFWATRPLAFNSFSLKRIFSRPANQYRGYTLWARTARHQNALKAQVLYALPSPYSWLKQKGLSHVDLLWLADPYLFALCDSIPHLQLAVQVTDDYRAFPNWGGDIEGVFPKTLKKAAAVFFTNKELMLDYIQAYHLNAKKCHYLSHGIDTPFWPELEARPCNKAVYVGVINEWIDWPWLRELSDNHYLNIDFYGPRSVKIQHPLWRYKGLVSNEKRAEVLSHYDVGLIPFKPSSLKKYSEPMKLYDYIAAGLPVLSRTPLPAWAEAFAPMITMDAALLSANAEQYYKQRLAHLDACKAFAHDNTWEKRWQSARLILAPCI